MKRVVLFSTPTEGNAERVSQALFPPEMTSKTLAYLPTNGSQSNQVYTDYWQEMARKNNTRFMFVDNTLPASSGEANKIETANILLITGGNTFELLHNLRQSNLDQAIKSFAQKSEFVLGGFSAGAIVLSPTINAANVPSGVDPTDLVDENKVGITDLTGLEIINFEIIPHYDEKTDKTTVENYRLISKYDVKTISDDEVMVSDL